MTKIPLDTGGIRVEKKVRRKEPVFAKDNYALDCLKNGHFLETRALEGTTYGTQNPILGHLFKTHAFPIMGKPNSKLMPSLK